MRVRSTRCDHAAGSRVRTASPLCAGRDDPITAWPRAPRRAPQQSRLLRAASCIVSCLIPEDRLDPRREVPAIAHAGAGAETKRKRTRSGETTHSRSYVTYITTKSRRRDGTTLQNHMCAWVVVNFVVTGCAPGADECAERAAVSRRRHAVGMQIERKRCRPEQDRQRDSVARDATRSRWQPVLGLAREPEKPRHDRSPDVSVSPARCAM